MAKALGSIKARGKQAKAAIGLLCRSVKELCKHPGRVTDSKFFSSATSVSDKIKTFLETTDAKEFVPGVAVSALTKVTQQLDKITSPLENVTDL